MPHLDHYVYTRGRAFQRTGVKAVIQIWRGVYPTNPRPLMMRGRQFISDAFDVEMINLWAASLGLSNQPLLELPSWHVHPASTQLRPIHVGVLQAAHGGHDGLGAGIVPWPEFIRVPVVGTIVLSLRSWRERFQPRSCTSIPNRLLDAASLHS